MTINEIGYMILEIVREGHVVDDERLDIRLLYDWIDLKRAQYIKNARAKNPNNRLNLNLYQKLDVDVIVSAVEDAGDYPYADSTTQLYDIVSSVDTIPAILEDNSGPIILSIESEDLMKLPFSVVDYDYMRVAGNGRFNDNLIFTAIRDNRIYFKYNEFFDTYTTVVIRAIFENPRDVEGYDNEETEYPANLGLIEYIKNAVHELDITKFFTGISDEVNNADGSIE